MKSSCRPCRRSCSHAIENCSTASWTSPSFEYSSASLMRFAMEVSGDGFVVLHRIAHQTELAIQLGELERDVDLARIELEDLLVDRDGFEKETLLVIEARDFEIRVSRVLLGALFRVEVADL